MELVRERCAKRNIGTPVDKSWEPPLAAFQTSIFLVSSFFMLQDFVTISHQGRRNSSRAGGAMKELRAMETYKNKTFTNMRVSVQ